MIILSKGFQLPQTLDTGAEFFPALETNIQKLNDHTHNGVDSQLLTAEAVTSVSQDISSASWSLVAVDHYRQLVTLPGTLSYDACTIQFRLSTGEIIHPTVERVSTTQYYVYVSDNTLNLKAVYST